MAATIVFTMVAGVVLLGLAPAPRGPSPRTFSNFRLLAQAESLYRQANNGYSPMVLSYQRGFVARPGTTLEGWCSWSFGGKNCNAYWATQVAFDVEAADRPFNLYVMPEQPFYAPAFPARLPANDPTRVSAEAEPFQDPGDIATFQRTWPSPTPTITGYNDVGTSYHTNMAWWGQLSSISNFINRFNEGTRRIAVGQGVNPSTFVWLTDQYGETLSQHPSPQFRLRNSYGDTNYAPMLFLDGHARYDSIRPTAPNTANYRFWFSTP